MKRVCIAYANIFFLFESTCFSIFFVQQPCTLILLLKTNNKFPGLHTVKSGNVSFQNVSNLNLVSLCLFIVMIFNSLHYILQGLYLFRLRERSGPSAASGLCIERDCCL